jgi:hypothetical protein
MPGRLAPVIFENESVGGARRAKREDCCDWGAPVGRAGQYWLPRCRACRPGTEAEHKKQMQIIFTRLQVFGKLFFEVRKGCYSRGQ